MVFLPWRSHSGLRLKEAPIVPPTIACLEMQPGDAQPYLSTSALRQVMTGYRCGPQGSKEGKKQKPAGREGWRVL